MRTVLVESILIMGIRRIKLTFEYDARVIKRVKAIYGSVWSSGMKSWHLPYNDDSIEEIGKLKLELGLDLLNYEHIKQERKSRYFDKRLNGEKENALMMFEQFL